MAIGIGIAIEAGDFGWGAVAPVENSGPDVGPRTQRGIPNVTVDSFRHDEVSAMRRSYRSPRPRLALLAIVALGVVSWSELQAGISYTHNAAEYPAALRAQKWSLAISGASFRKEDEPKVNDFDPKRLVVQAIQDLPGSADQVPLETRKELARIAEETFNNGRSELKKGRIDNIEYLIGRYSFNSRPRPGSGEGRLGPDRGVRTLWMPIVAIRIRSGVSVQLDQALALIEAPEDARPDLPKALAAAEKACELTYRRNAECLQILAAVHARMGDFEKAIQWQKLALELFPEERKGFPLRRLERYEKRKTNIIDFDPNLIDAAGATEERPRK
jgi:tetratricopeptide (TPR) repeat protein